MTPEMKLAARLTKPGTSRYTPSAGDTSLGWNKGITKGRSYNAPKPPAFPSASSWNSRFVRKSAI